MTCERVPVKSLGAHFGDALLQRGEAAETLQGSLRASFDDAAAGEGLKKARLL